MITNDHLRALVAGIIARPSNSQGLFFETGLTAMLRVIDTIRGTVDAKERHSERPVRLLGNPLAVVRARLWAEATADDGVAGAPAPLADHPAFSVRVGAIDQPDDGVLGCFIPGEGGPEGSVFLPVSAEAAKKAIVTGLPDATGMSVTPINHPLIPADQESQFTLAPGQQRDLTVLLDLSGGVYLTSGVLPRKRLTLPREFYADAARRLEPTFRVGPLLAVPDDDAPRPILPCPQLEHYVERWVEDPGVGAPEDAYVAQAIPRIPAVGELPRRRCVLTRGWLRMTPGEDE